MVKNSDKEKIGKIVETFSSKLLAHAHPINRKEAKNYNLKVKTEKPEIERIIWELFKQYEDEMNLNEFFSPITEFKKIKPQIPLSLGNQLQPVMEDVKGIKLAVIESENFTDINTQDLQVTALKFVDAAGNINENYSWIIKNQGWTREP